MNKPSILLLDNLPERASSTRFLLQLANCQVAVVNSDEEAYNWLVSRVDSSEQASLLLLNDFQLQMPILKLLPQLKKRGVSLPVLVVNRDNNRAASELAGSESVVCCSLDEMLGQVRLMAAVSDHGSAASRQA